MAEASIPVRFIRSALAHELWAERHVEKKSPDINFYRERQARWYLIRLIEEQTGTKINKRRTR